MRASQILLFSWELRCDKEERQLEIARDVLKEALWIIVLLLLFPSIWFYPLHNKKPCWLLYCLGFCACPSHSECQCNAGLQKQVRLWPRVGPGLSKYDVNHNRTQTCSVLRGQVPFPYKNLAVNMAGVFGVALCCTSRLQITLLKVQSAFY